MTVTQNFPAARTMPTAKCENALRKMLARCGALCMKADSSPGRLEPTPTFSPPTDQRRPLSLADRLGVWNRYPRSAISRLWRLAYLDSRRLSAKRERWRSMRSRLVRLTISWRCLAAACAGLAITPWTASVAARRSTSAPTLRRAIDVAIILKPPDSGSRRFVAPLRGARLLRQLGRLSLSSKRCGTVLCVPRFPARRLFGTDPYVLPNFYRPFGGANLKGEPDPARGGRPLDLRGSCSTQINRATPEPIGRAVPRTRTGIACTLGSTSPTLMRVPGTSPYASSWRRSCGASCSATSEIRLTRAGTPGSRSASATSSPYGGSRPGITLPCGQVVGRPRVSSSLSATRSDTPGARIWAS